MSEASCQCATCSAHREFVLQWSEYSDFVHVPNPLNVTSVNAKETSVPSLITAEKGPIEPRDQDLVSPHGFPYVTRRSRCI
jgi:hypothetical protein